MNWLKKIFSKKEKADDLDEIVLRHPKSSSRDTSYGDTVLLNNQNKNLSDDYIGKTVLLSNEGAFDEVFDDIDIIGLTATLDVSQDIQFEDNPLDSSIVFENIQSEAITEPLKDIVNHNDTDFRENGDTVILTQNDSQYHAGDTVILNKTRNQEKFKNKLPDNLFLINPSTGEKILISSCEYKIGSDKRFVDLVIYKEGISRHHATVFVEDGNCYIVDNNSTNGTEIEGVLLDSFKKYPLENGVLITLANEIFQFYIEK